MEQVCQYPLVVTRHGDYWRDTLESELLSRNLRHHVAVETDVVSMVKRHIWAGAGVSVLPESVIEDEDRKHLSTAVVADLLIEICVGAVTKRGILDQRILQLLAGIEGRASSLRH